MTDSLGAIARARRSAVRQRSDRLATVDVTQFGLGNVCTSNVIYLDLEPNGQMQRGDPNEMDRHRTTRISIPVLAAVALWTGRTPHADSNVP